ncbi:MAG: protein kinase [Polyangiaceae bacterium]
MDPHADRVGQTLRGKYRLEELLGEGGMAQVYRARNLLAGREVAIKMLHPERSSQGEAVRRFMREAKAANSVRHPNIVDVLDVDTDEAGVPFIVQEYLVGVDLAAKMDEGWRLSPDEVLELFIPIAEAVGEAHEAGIVHRDLKPDNVFLAVDRDHITPKVLDFGISKVPLEESGDLLSREGTSGVAKHLTAAGSAMGTPLYMSPEQIRDPRSVTPATDVWSLGVMLYEALSGEIPFDGDTVVELFSRIKTTEPVSLERLVPELPHALVRIVQRCLDPEPKRRFDNGEALAKALREVRDRVHATANTVPPKLSFGPPASAPPPSSDAELGVLGAFMEGSPGEVDPHLLAPSSDDGLAFERVPTPKSDIRDLAPRELDRPASDRKSAQGRGAVHRAIERAIRDVLRRRGIDAEVVVAGDVAEIHHPEQGVVAIELGDLVEQWSVLPADVCDRRAEAVAMRLERASHLPPPRAARPTTRRSWLFLAIGLAVAGGIAVRLVLLAASRPDPAPPATATAPPLTQEERAREHCDTTRRQLYASGKLAGLDISGWVVELWLARRESSSATPPLAADPAVLAFVAAAKSDLGASFAAEPAPLGPYETVMLRGEGPAAAAFFESRGRDRLVQLAHDLTHAAAVDHAALFGRCAHRQTRDIGAWYAGKGRGAAIASLLEAAGGYADPPAFELGDPADEGARLARLGATKLDEAQVEATLTKAGARLEESPDLVTLRFPLGGPTRAAQASRELYPSNAHE